MSTVGLVKGDDRYSNVLQALTLAGDEVRRRIRGRVLIKVNTVVEDSPQPNTHVDALRAVLEFLRPLKPDRVVVGEASGNVLRSFRDFGFETLKATYKVEFLDFNAVGFQPLELLGIDGNPLPARLTRACRDFDCLISLSVPKAHSDAVVTLSGKNMMGFVAGEEIWKIHGVKDFGNHLVEQATVIHQNLRRLLKAVRPDVAVLDAFHSFEGGRVPQCGEGTRVEPHLAFAGADFVAVDTVAATALGFDPQDVGYLVYSAQDGYGTGDLSKIEIAGTPLREAMFPLKPALTLDRILGWKKVGSTARTTS